ERPRLDADVRHIRTPCVSSRTGWHKPDRYTATLRKAGLLAGARHTGADLAGHPGAADAAVAHRVLVQVLLVVGLGVVERARLRDLRRHRTHAGITQRGLVVLRRRLGGFPLFLVGPVDGRAVLRADVVALPHALRRVVVLPEHLQQLFVGDPLRVVDHQHDLGVPGAPGADLLVRRVRREPTGVARR